MKDKKPDPDPDGTLSGDRRGKWEALVNLIFVIRMKSYPAFAHNPVKKIRRIRTRMEPLSGDRRGKGGDVPPLAGP